jgi:hypothetical protein
MRIEGLVFRLQMLNMFASRNTSLLVEDNIVISIFKHLKLMNLKYGENAITSFLQEVDKDLKLSLSKL